MQCDSKGRFLFLAFFSVLLLVALSLAMACGRSAVAGPTIYTEHFTGSGQPADWSAYTDDGSGPTAEPMYSRILSQEYEQRKAWGTLPNPVPAHEAIAYLDDQPTTVRGMWRDSTVSVLTRHSGGGANLNGLIVRASDIGDTTSGDFYHARINGSALDLYRVRGGSYTLLGTTTAGPSFGDTANKRFTVTTSNVPSPNTDHVRIQATLYTDAAGTTVARSIDYLDGSAAAITRAGGVGFRTRNSSSANHQRAVWDDLAVETNHPTLLWYDDYYDNQAPMMVSSLGASQSEAVVNGKYGFSGSGGAAAWIENGSMTDDPSWENVEATALVRLQTSAAIRGGLMLRAQDVTTIGSGYTDGDFYYMQLVRNEGANAAALRLYRVVDGGLSSPLANDLSGLSLVPESTDIFLKFTAITRDDGVHLSGLASLNADFSDPLSMLSYIDSSSSQILGPGTAGFHMLDSGTINFDNFTITAVPEPAALGLLFVACVGVLPMRRIWRCNRRR